jgi:predicted extracellular nuclease
VFLRQNEKDRIRSAFPRLPIFDGNPEKLRVESTAQPGAEALDVAFNTAIDDLTGVLHYSFRNYTIFVDPDSKHTVSGSITPLPMPVPDDDQLVVAAANIFNFFDDVNDPGMNEDVVTKEGFEARMQKISLAFRTVLRNPDVIAVSEAETLSGLRRLSARINADTIAAGGDDPKYEAYLVPGNDRRGINNGFLVKSSRVNVIEVSQLGKEERFRNERTGESNYLNDRPPLLVRVSVGEDDARFGVTLIANHLRSFLGYNDPDQGGNVRLKKRLQAEYLASIVESRLKADPSEKVIVLGDLNFYQFPDGILDVTGIIAGRPASKEEVMIFSPVSFTPPLANLVDLIDRGQRYSYVFDGNAQVLDHILVSGSLRPYVIGFGYARLNADFPEIYFNDPLRPERFSDHDPAVAYFSLRATSGN